ncbi:hypothetical protein BDL97_12G074800 [Sphagnum fallax]|nr:hypothetical protein BDL97_12G074800 [Sphagnum fallax]
MMVFFCFMAVHNGFMKVPLPSLSPLLVMAKQELITPAGRSCCRRRSLVFSFFFLCPERWCQKRDLASWAQHLLPATKTGPSLGQKLIVEKLWWEFFSDPSQWWDNRVEKMSARYPDFKHKLTQEALWLDSKLNPAWVKAELSAMVPGTVQSDIFSWNVRLARFCESWALQDSDRTFSTTTTRRHDS